MQARSDRQVGVRPPVQRRPLLNEEARAGLVFVSPFIFGFLVFVAGPLLYSLYLGFTAYDITQPAGVDRPAQLPAHAQRPALLQNAV